MLKDPGAAAMHPNGSAELSDFAPSDVELELLIGQIFECAHHIGDPLRMLKEYGKPYVFDDDEDNFCILEPWSGVSGRLLLAREEGPVVWMHPALRSRLGIIQPEQFAGIAECRSDNTSASEFAAEALWARFERDLATLDTQLAKTEAFRRGVLTISGCKSLEDVVLGLDRLAEQSEITPDLAWAMAELTLKADPPRFFVDGAATRPLRRASIIAQLVDRSSVSAPSEAEARAALARQRLLSLQQRTSGSQSAMDLEVLVHAVVHGILPETLDEASGTKIYAFDLFDLQLTTGELDPYTEDPEAGYGLLLLEIGRLFSRHGPLSNHELLSLLDTVNTRLEAVGCTRRLTVQDCRDAAQEVEAFPF
jgi:hypothetical protein